MANTSECRKIMKNQDQYHRSSGLKDAVSGTGHSVEYDQQDDTLLEKWKRAFLREASFP